MNLANVRLLVKEGRVNKTMMITLNRRQQHSLTMFRVMEKIQPMISRWKLLRGFFRQQKLQTSMTQRLKRALRCATAARRK